MDAILDCRAQAKIRQDAISARRPGKLRQPDPAAASVSALILTTDAMVAELPKDEKGMAAGMAGGGMGDMGY